jgi:LuxR family maltose regulon positive regulatory protein
MEDVILQTRLHMPAARPLLVARAHLNQKLDQGLSKKLTLVSAPAGYGKTTLVAEWGGRVLVSPATLGWLSLDEDDNDPLHFFAYVLAALQKAGLNLATTAQYLQGLTHLASPQTFVTRLLNEIGQADGRNLLLVLDDYHKIQTTLIHDALQFWLDHAPPHLHLLLITREDPPLTLSRWRARSQMTEIRAADLRFSQAEAASFLNQTMGLSLTTADVAALEQRTEGWIAGLQLAALALQSPQSPTGHANAADFIAAFGGSHHYIIDYLVEEVLRQQEGPVRHFLQATAVLQRFTPGLCNAVTGRQDSQDILAYLERSNLFLVPLDDRRLWYRYHQLFADSLRTRLETAVQNESHRRAADWLADQKLYAEAIDHASAAGDEETLTRLIRLASEPAFRQGEIRQIAAWLKRLPQDVIIRDSELAVFWLLSLILTGRSQEAPTAIALLEPHLAHWQNPRQQARLQAIKAWVADITGSNERIALAQEAAAALTADDQLFRAFIALPLGHACLYQGQPQVAIDVFRQGLALLPQKGTTFVRISLLSNLIHTLNHAGRRREAWAACQQAITEFVDGDGEPLPPAGLPYLLSAWLHYDANRLDRARQDVMRGLTLLREAFQETMLTPLEVELVAWLHEVVGEMELAQATVAAGLARATTQQYQHGMVSLERLAAELRLRNGEWTAVRRWVEAQPIYAGRQPDGRWQIVEPLNDASYLIYTRLLLHDGRIEEAGNLLSLLAASARDGGRVRNLIVVLLLQAVASAEPLPFMQEAVQRAAAEQYVRLILDECAFPAHGPFLASLLRQTAVRQTAPDFTAVLLAALPEEPTTTHPLTHAPELLEPLTEQEMVVLRLLAAGLSNQQIANELVITVGTAKWHVHNLYQKLGVGSRAAAVARIHEWQLAGA